MDTAYITVLFSVMVFNPAHGSDRYSTREDTEHLLRLQGVRMKALEMTVRELIGTVHELKGTNHELKGTIHELKGTVNELKGTIHELKGTVHEQQLEINKLNQITKTYRNGAEVESIPVDSNGTDCTTKSKRDVMCEKQIKRRLTDKARRLLVGHAPVHSSTVAFYAYLGKSESSIGLHHSLIFDVVITNLGNGYNKHTGAFIAPQDGVYVLTLTIFPNRGTITSVHILRNSNVVGDIFGDMSSGPHLSGSTGVVVVTMNTGDAATIRTSSTFQSRGDLISNPNMKTSFAGWKLADIS